MKKYKFMLFIIIVQCNTVYPNKREATDRALDTLNIFFNMFLECISEPITSMQFEADNIKKFIIYPSKTTVGFGPKYTSNRKFFGNLITTPAFKEMLENDKKALVTSTVRKLKYCDEAVMDPTLLNDFYDREVDQNKM